MSDKTKHTQWFVGAQNDELYVIDAPPSPSNDNPDHLAQREVIAKVYPGKDLKETVNRGCLLAASPDLLAACKHALKSIEAVAEAIGADTDPSTAVRMLQEAIAKAEGRSS